MSASGRLIPILIAEDDEDDQFLIREAFKENNIANPITFVKNGEELLEFLFEIKKRNRKKGKSLPGLILLDLNLPRKDGREALAEIKKDPLLRRIQVVVFTTSKAEEDIIRSYDLCVAGFITKPDTFQSLVEIIHVIKEYWLTIVKLPEF